MIIENDNSQAWQDLQKSGGITKIISKKTSQIHWVHGDRKDELLAAKDETGKSKFTAAGQDADVGGGAIGAASTLQFDGDSEEAKAARDAFNEIATLQKTYKLEETKLARLSACSEYKKTGALNKKCKFCKKPKKDWYDQNKS
jgi:hypothetical protein